MEDNKKLSPWKKILVSLILVISAVLVFFFVNSCSQTTTSFDINEVVGESYFSVQKNYILNFVSATKVNYIDESEEESILLEYTTKDNVIYLQREEGDVIFIALNRDQILYQKINKILFRTE